MEFQLLKCKTQYLINTECIELRAAPVLSWMRSPPWWWQRHLLAEIGWGSQLMPTEDGRSFAWRFAYIRRPKFSVDRFPFDACFIYYCTLAINTQRSACSDNKEDICCHRLRRTFLCVAINPFLTSCRAILTCKRVFPSSKSSLKLTVTFHSYWTKFIKMEIANGIWKWNIEAKLTVSMYI